MYLCRGVSNTPSHTTPKGANDPRRPPNDPRRGLQFGFWPEMRVAAGPKRVFDPK